MPPRVQAVLELLEVNLVVAGLEKDAADLLMRREWRAARPLLLARWCLLLGHLPRLVV